MNKTTILWRFLFFIPLFQGAMPAQAQQPAFHCASDEMMQSRPDILLRQQQTDNFLMEQTASGTAAKASPLPYSLPVVVHIIHNNGPENIPDTQVLKAIEHLNQAFAHEGYYAAQGSGTDAQIQFCLARRTPDGLPTNGITRTQSLLTNLVKETDDFALKDLSRWNTQDYINIWVVQSINSLSSGPGVAGYAFLASAHGQAYDGLVCEVGFFGVDAAKDAVLIHEIGHYLNLHHTFEGGCANDDCLASGDRVCDTPPDQATHSICAFNSCGTDADDASANNPFGTDVDDATENFMDYSPFACYRNFTEGQATRMRTAIEMVRNSLLLSDGCKEACTLPIAAAFVPSATEVEAGGTAVFTNQLSAGATHFEWFVNGGLVATTTDFSYQFNNTGIALVTLQAYNDDPNCEAEASVAVQVTCGVEAAFTTNATELLVGGTLACTNASTGATGYEWFINGVSVGTGADLDYTFSDAGFYTVRLRALGDYCSDETTLGVAVQQEGPCQGFAEGWTWTLGGSTNPYMFFGEQHQGGGVYLNNYLYPNGLVTKLNAAGDVLWNKLIAVPVNGLGDLHTTQDGGCVASMVGSGNIKRKFCKLATDGTVEWAKNLGFLGISQDVRLQPVGNKIVAFTHGVSPAKFMALGFGADGSGLWNKVYSISPDIFVYATAPAIDSSGLWMVGNFGFPRGLAVAKLDTAGNIVLIKRYAVTGNNDPLELRHVDTTPDGGIIASGRVTLPNSNNDFIILKFDASGNIEWSKKIGTYTDGVLEIGRHVIARPNGGYLVQYAAHNEFSAIVAFSEAGNLEFAEQISFEGNALPYIGQFTEQNGQMQAWLQTVGEKMTSLDLDPAGHFVSCAEASPLDLLATDYPLSEQPVTISLLAETTPVTDAAIDELPITDPLSKAPTCIVEVPCPEICDNSLDDDGDGFVDCFDEDCPCYEEALPDATVSLDSLICEGDSLRVWLVLCNEGSEPLPDGLPLAFYQNDPRLPGAVWHSTFFVNTAVPVDTCLSFSVNIPAIFNAPIFVVANDDGSQTLPYTLANFPVTDVAEGGYQDNFDSVSFSYQNASLDLGSDFSICGSSVKTLHAGPGFASYRWQDGSVEPDFTAFGAGTYWVDVWDACGNRSTDTLVISLNLTANVELGDDVTICEGEPYELSVPGFDAVLWSPTVGLSCANCPTATATPSGNITYYVTAASGDCFASDSIRIFVKNKPSLTLTAIDGDCDEAATITAAASGQAPFVFAWSNGSLTNDTIHPTQAGTYTATVTDAGGCSSVASTNVAIVGQLQLGISLSPITCHDSANGTATVLPLNGTPPFVWQWQGGQTDSMLTGLGAGNYAVTVTDVVGCSDVLSFSITAPAPLALGISGSDVSCFGNMDGTATLTASGGTPNYSYHWSNGPTAAHLTQLAPGWYSATVTDGNGCTDTTGLLITGPSLLTVAVSASPPVVCPGGAASVFPVVNGGTGPYAFAWPGGQTDSLLTNQPVGEYVVMVTDAQGCSASGSTTIVAVPAMVLVQDSIAPASGGAVADGGVFVELAGGAPPLSFLWSNGATTPSLENVLPGDYSLTVTDAEGCEAAFAFTVGVLVAAGQVPVVDWSVFLVPNPSALGGVAQLSLDIATAQTIDLEVFDVAGQPLSQERLALPAGVALIEMPLPVAAGVYLVVVSNGQGVVVLKWVVL